MDKLWIMSGGRSCGKSRLKLLLAAALAQGIKGDIVILDNPASIELDKLATLNLPPPIKATEKSRKAQWKSEIYGNKRRRK